MSEWLASLLHPDLHAMTAVTVYAVVWGLVFAESGLLFGFFLPGDTVLFTAGLVSAEPSAGVSLPVLAGGTFVAAVAGDAVGYWCGRRLGRPWLERRAGRMAEHLARAERFYDRYGWWAVVACRFIPWVRTFTPILAGVARMPYPRFFAANVVGALVWGVGLITLGHVAHAVTWVRYAAYAVAAVAVLMSLVAPLLARRRARREPAAASEPADDAAAGRARE